MKGWPARNSLSPSICSDVSQFVRKKLETKVIAQIVTTILQGLLFRGLWSYLLGQVCFLVVVVFFFFDKQSPCELCRSFNHLVLIPGINHILQPSPPRKGQKEQEEPERSFTQKAGILWCLEECLQPAPRELTRLHEACRLQWTGSKGEILEVPSPLCGTEFHLSSRETQMPLWSHGPPRGFQISLCEKSNWATPSPGALWNWWEVHV